VVVVQKVTDFFGGGVKMKNRITLPTIVVLVFTIVTTFAKAEFRISSFGYDVSVDGNIIVFEKNGDIYGYNLSTSLEFPICANPYRQLSPAISGNIVVWGDYRKDEDYPDIYGYNLSTSTEFPICTNPDDQYGLAISGNIVVWVDRRNGNYDIYGYNLATSTEFLISTKPGYRSDLAIGGDTVVWFEENDNSLHLYNLQSSTETHFIILAWLSTTSTDGNFVVWRYESEAGPEFSGVWVLHLDSPDEYSWSIEVNKAVPYYGSNTGMTGMAITSCGYNDTKDIWHSFTPTSSGDYTVSTCGSSFDTTLAVFDANKEGEIACNDDSCGYQSQLTFKAKAGKQYLIRVAGYDEDAGNYVLTISGGPAECANRPSADLNGDCKVDLHDIAIVCSQWLDCGLDDPDACWE
jgi:beta propeller repeat protein